MPLFPPRRKKPTAAPPAGEVGTDTGWWDDLRPDREDNPELSRHERYQLYDRMVLGDPIIRGLLSTVKLPLRQSGWYVEPHPDDPNAEATKEIVEWQLGLTAPGPAGMFDDMLGRSLMCLNYGSMTQEIVWSKDTVDIGGRPIRPIVKLAARYPHAIERYYPPQDATQALGAIDMWMVEKTIPGDKLMHHVIEPEAAPDAGVSIIRPAYSFWKIKKGVVVASAIGFDRFAHGLPVFYYPASEQNAGMRARQMGEALRSHERAFFAFPGPKPGPGEDGWTVELLSGAGTLADPVPFLRHLDQQIVAAAVAEFTRLGTTETGSRAVGQVLAEPFYLSLQSLAHQMAQDYTHQFIERFVAHNLPNTPAPTLVPPRLREQDIAALSRALVEGSSAGMNFADLDTQNHYRQLLGLPELDEAQRVPEGF